MELLIFLDDLFANSELASGVCDDLFASVQRLRRCDKQWARLPRAWRGSDICSTVIPLSCIRTFPCVQYSPSSHSCVILEVHRTYGYYTLRINSDRMSCPLGKFLVKCHPSEGLKDGYPVSHLYLSLYYVVGRGAFLRPAPKAKPHSAKIKKKKKASSIHTPSIILLTGPGGSSP